MVPGSGADKLMMGTDRLLCPGCSGDLMANQVSGLRQYVCTACGGTVLTIAVLRQLEGGLAEHLWTEDRCRTRPVVMPGARSVLG